MKYKTPFLTLILLQSFNTFAAGLVEVATLTARNESVVKTETDSFAETALTALQRSIQSFSPEAQKDILESTPSIEPKMKNVATGS